MIRLNRNDPSELLIDYSELKLLRDRSNDLTEMSTIKQTVEEISQYEQQNNLLLSDIRVKRNTPLGKYLFEHARKEVAKDSEQIIDSLIFNATFHDDDDFFDHIYDALKQEETSPSDYMVEQILLTRKNCFTDEKKAPYCVQLRQEEMEKSGDFVLKK